MSIRGLICFVIGVGFQLVTAQSTQVRLSYIWPLAFIHNRTIPVTPPLQVHGNVKLAEDGLLLDGQNAWIDGGDFAGSCMCHPDQCVVGLSLALRIKFDSSIRSYVLDTSPKFVIDSGGYNGEGISVYTKNGEIFFEVGSKDSLWKVSTNVVAEKWHFILVTWSEDEGLKVFMNGPMIGYSNTPIRANSKASVSSTHIVIGRGNFEAQDTFGRFLIDLVALFDSYVPSGKIYLSYAYSEPKKEGNIRYVNARFINNADFKLSIFPDRGERRIKGYHLNPKASTLLEFVLREGPLPTGMRFELRNKQTGKILKHKQSNAIAVISSDDSQMITDIQVRQDGKVFVSVSSLGINPNYEISSTKTTPTPPKVEVKLPVNKPPTSVTTAKETPPPYTVPENQMPPIRVAANQAAPIVSSNRTEEQRSTSVSSQRQGTEVGSNGTKVTSNVVSTIPEYSTTGATNGTNPSNPGQYNMLGTGRETYGPNVTINNVGNGSGPTSSNVVLTSELPDEDQLGISSNYSKPNTTSVPVTQQANTSYGQSYNTSGSYTNNAWGGYSPVSTTQEKYGYNYTVPTSQGQENTTSQMQGIAAYNQNGSYGNESNQISNQIYNNVLEGQQNQSQIVQTTNITSYPVNNSTRYINTTNQTPSINASTTLPNIINASTTLPSNTNATYYAGNIIGSNTTQNVSSFGYNNNETNSSQPTSTQQQTSVVTPDAFKDSYQQNLPHRLSNQAAYNAYVQDYYKQLNGDKASSIHSDSQNATAMREWTDNSGPDMPAAYAPVPEDVITGVVRENRPENKQLQAANANKVVKEVPTNGIETSMKFRSLSPNQVWTKTKTADGHKGYAFLINPKVNAVSETTMSPYIKLETSNGEPGFALPLTRIENKRILPAPGLKCQGMIENANGGLKFDGATGWIDAGDFNGTFLADPSTSKNGFGIGLKLLLDASIQGYDSPKYILDTGGLNGKGVSIYMESGKIVTVVAVGEQMWTVESRVDLDVWFYFIMSWSSSTGLTVYIDGAKYTDTPTPTKIVRNQPESSHLVIGTSVLREKESFASFSISLIDIFESSVNPIDLVGYSIPIVRPENIWTLSSLKDQTVAGKPELKLHGNVEEVRGALVFDGENAFISYDGHDLERSINNPELSTSGISLAIKVKLDKIAVKKYLEERFLVDSGGWLGHGISIFVMEGEIYGVIGYKGDIWRVVIDLQGTDLSSWLFVVLTFREDIGLSMYINGALAGVEKRPKYFVDEFKPADSLTIGCSILRSSVSFAKFQLSLVAFFLEYFHVDEIVKMSPPLIIKPYFDWFLMLTKNGSTLTTPPLKVRGGVETTENGLFFDGKTGWLDAGDLEESADENAEIVCEHFAKDIACPRGQIIRVTYANYGRTSDIPCQGKRTYTQTDCVSPTSKTIARQICDSKRSCRLKALNSIWGNTCYGVVKYVEIKYQCIGVIREGNEKVGVHFLTNPSLAEEGLTIGLKVKLDEEAQSYYDPHYILDSGGHEGRGLSVYVMKGDVHCEIGTRGQMWMVSTKLAPSMWHYLLLTWRQDQGIALYVNGVIRALETVPIVPPSGGGGGTLSGTFVIGRSSLEKQASHAKFYITLLTVLRTWISKSESFRMFAMYWGRTINNAMEASVSEQEMAIICEYHTKKIECPADQTIKILSANWGRTSKVPCAWGQHMATNCTSTTAKIIAAQVCDGKNFCELTAKTSEWGNPCPGIVKYLEVKYICDERLALGGSLSGTYIGNEDPGSLVIP